MKKIAILFASALFALPMSAQVDESSLDVKADTVTALRHYKFWDNWYLGLHAGGNWTLGENVRPENLRDVGGTSFALSIGKWFSPAIGVRAQVGYMSQKGMFPEELNVLNHFNYEHNTYRYDNFYAYVDGMFNFTNIFGKYNENTRFNIIGLFGLGGNATTSFEHDLVMVRNNENFDNAEHVGDGFHEQYHVNTESRSFFAARAGFMLTYKLNEAWDVTGEATMNATRDDYNGVGYDDKWDGYVNFLLGLNYHFKDHYGDRRFKYTSVNDADYLDSLNAKVNEARQALADAQALEKKKVYETNEFLNMTVSFNIDKSNITKIQKKNIKSAVEYLNNHPEQNLLLIGYADVQTANPNYNMGLSYRRAQAVYDMVTKEFGLDPSRVRIEYKGDTVQPYDEKNEWNRVVIFQTEPRN